MLSMRNFRAQQAIETRARNWPPPPGGITSPSVASAAAAATAVAATPARRLPPSGRRAGHADAEIATAQRLTHCRKRDLAVYGKLPNDKNVTL